MRESETPSYLTVRMQFPFPPQKQTRSMISHLRKTPVNPATTSFPLLLPLSLSHTHIPPLHVHAKVRWHSLFLAIKKPPRRGGNALEEVVKAHEY